MPSKPFDELETVLACLKRMEITIEGMRQMRQFVNTPLGKKMLEELIEQAEKQIAEIKRKVVQ